MNITIQTFGTADEQAGQICTALENADIRILMEDNSFDHAFGTEPIYSYYIEQPEISMTVECEAVNLVYSAITHELHDAAIEFASGDHTVIANVMDYSLSYGTDKFEIEFEFELQIKET